MEEKIALQKLVDECYSFTEILQKQGKAVSGAAVKVLKNTLDAYDIDYSLLTIKNNQKKKSNPRYVPIEEILVENCPYPRKFVKQRLLESGLKENKCECEGCISSNIWNGKPLVMQLHHLNGINNDNRLANLIMLCPNCHSQTENYGGGQRKLEQKFCECGKPIGRRSTYCSKCAAKRNNKPKVENKPAKDELLQMIMNESFVAIGRKYGVSDRAISKWCLNYGLPHTKRELKDYIQQNGPLV